MKCCDIHSGKLKSKITIERLTDVPDGSGGSTRTWATEGTPFAIWKGLSGGERWLAMRVSPANRFRAIIRFKGDANGGPYYSGADRVVYRGRTYAIDSVIDMDDEQKYLELMLTETKAS